MKWLSVFVNVFVAVRETKGRTDELWCHLSCTVYLLQSAETHGCRVSRCLRLFVDVLMERHRFRVSVVLSWCSRAFSRLGRGGTWEASVHPGWKWTFPTDIMSDKVPFYILNIYYTVHVWAETNSHFFFFLKTDLIYKEWRFYSISTDGPQDPGGKQQRWILHMNNCK